ncbi:tetratricopeptide repeat protein [Bradyrhizobium sp. 13971]
MKLRASAGAIVSLTSLLVAMLPALPAVAQNPKKDNYLRTIGLCSGLDRTPADARVAACTALIDAGQDMTPAGLAIAYNNRGNAYAAKGDYDGAIRDFDRSIELNPTYTKPFNNRGVAYLQEARIRSRDRRLRSGDQAQPELRGGLRQSRRRLFEAERFCARGAGLR